MKEGSYLQIEPGMAVVDAQGKPIGRVREVLADEGSGIFHGLTVSEGTVLGGRTLEVRGELVERLHDGVVTLSAVEGELKEYTPRSEAHNA